MVEPASHGAPTSEQSAVWIIERLLLDANRNVDRALVRRAMQEASLAWGGDPAERWWKWLVEASGSLGLKTKVLDCTFAQLLELAREGAQIVLFGTTTHHWLAITAWRRGRVRVAEPYREESERWTSRSHLRELLGNPEPADVVRCVVVDPSGVTVTGEEHPLREKAGPLQLYWALLRPEWPDVWIILVFALVAGLLTLATPIAVESLVNTVAFGRFLQPVIVLALILFAFLAFSAAIRGWQTFVVEIIQRRLFARVAADLAYRLPRVRQEEVDAHYLPELVNRFSDVVTVQKVSAQLLLDGVSLVLTALIGMAVLAFYHPWLLGFDVVLIALIGFVILVMGRNAVATSIKESKCKYHMLGWLEDLARCPTVFKQDGGAEFALERADRLIYEYLAARKAHFRVLMRQILFALGLQALASTVLLGLGGWLVISGQLTLGQLVAAELIVTVIVGSFAKVGKHLESYYDLMAAVDKLGHLFELRTERQDGLLEAPHHRLAEVQLSSVGYEFPDSQEVLKSVTVRIGVRERVAVTGSSGSGKTILLDLLFGLRTPTSGHLAINGIDPRDLRPDTLRRHVALVRDIEIFEGTVEENVHLERTDVSTHDVRAALETVGLLDIIMHLPQGLATELDRSGRPLTDMQLRRLMLARAIAGRPTLLLIDALLDGFPDDEATALAQSLCAPSWPWTLLLATVRKPLAAICERVLVLRPEGKAETVASTAGARGER